MASQIVMVRIAPERVQKYKQLVENGEYASLSDAVRGLADERYAQMELDAILEDIREDARRHPIKGDIVQMIRDGRKEMWEEDLAEAGGDRKKAIEIGHRKAGALMKKFRLQSQIVRSRREHSR